MYLCYVDESGTADLPGNTSHFILAGLSIPISQWKACDLQIASVKARYGLQDAEIHVAWLLRKYIEQSKIQGFEALDPVMRRAKVDALRKAELLRLQRAKNPTHYRQTKKNYRQTDSYIHLTLDERRQFVTELAKCLAGWGFARLLAECIDKVHFDQAIANKTVSEQAFEQLVSRFERFLKNIGTIDKTQYPGLLIHDNNDTIAKRHTELMKSYHRQGTLWTDIANIIETPLFVNSELTSMVQVADLCAYALRRYLENSEKELFSLVFQRADRIGPTAVGVRHYTKQPCKCIICASHNR
jgi:hypothetical protein